MATEVNLVYSLMNLPRFFIIFGNDDFGTNLGTAV